MKTRYSQAYDEYVKRLRPVLALDTCWHKTDEDLEAAVRKDTGAVVRDAVRTHHNLKCHIKFGPGCLVFVHDCIIRAEPGTKASPMGNLKRSPRNTQNYISLV